MRFLTFCCICFFADIWPSRTKVAGYYVAGVNLQTHILPQSEVTGLLIFMSICEHAFFIVFVFVNLHFLKAVVLATFCGQRGEHNCMLGRLCISSDLLHKAGQPEGKIFVEERQRERERERDIDIYLFYIARTLDQ